MALLEPVVLRLKLGFSIRCRVYSLRFLDLEFGVGYIGLGFRVWGLGCRVQDIRGVR